MSGIVPWGSKIILRNARGEVISNVRMQPTPTVRAAEPRRARSLVCVVVLGVAVSGVAGDLAVTHPALLGAQPVAAAPTTPAPTPAPPAQSVPAVSSELRRMQVRVLDGSS